MYAVVVSPCKSLLDYTCGEPKAPQENGMRTKELRKSENSKKHDALRAVLDPSGAWRRDITEGDQMVGLPRRSTQSNEQSVRCLWGRGARGRRELTKEKTNEEDYGSWLNRANALSSRPSDTELDVSLPAGAWKISGRLSA
jgi:hypothetical protein